MNYTYTFTEDEVRLLIRALREYDYQTFDKKENLKKKGYNPLNPIDLSRYNQLSSIEKECEKLEEKLKKIINQ